MHLQFIVRSWLWKRRLHFQWSQTREAIIKPRHHGPRQAKLNRHWTRSRNHSIVTSHTKSNRLKPRSSRTQNGVRLPELREHLSIRIFLLVVMKSTEEVSSGRYLSDSPLNQSEKLAQWDFTLVATSCPQDKSWFMIKADPLRFRGMLLVHSTTRSQWIISIIRLQTDRMMWMVPWKTWLIERHYAAPNSSRGETIWSKWHQPLPLISM